MATKKTTKTEPTATETYAARAKDIARLMEMLKAELRKDAEAEKADPGNWGHAGGLGKVREDLIGAVSFMQGTDPEDVEAFLAK